MVNNATAEIRELPAGETHLAHRAVRALRPVYELAPGRAGAPVPWIDVPSTQLARAPCTPATAGVNRLCVADDRDIQARSQRSIRTMEAEIFSELDAGQEDALLAILTRLAYPKARP